MTHAGVLLFGKQPQRLFPLAQVRLARFVGDRIADERTLGGTLWDQVGGAMDYLREHVGVEYRVEAEGQGIEGLQRTEVRPYPSAADGLQTAGTP
ncbi:MAG: hypothetical protein GX496_05160 [Firmicutes bacterium]|nr:hypothetical protein [Bacillota bacterium]